MICQRENTRSLMNVRHWLLSFKMRFKKSFPDSWLNHQSVQILCLDWTCMSPAECAMLYPHPHTNLTSCESPKTSGAGGGCGVSTLGCSPTSKAIVVCGEVPLFLKVELVTFSPVKRWLNDASFVQRNECCKRSGFMQGNDSHRGGIWCLLSKSLNVSDPDVNAWPPECVVHDIDPLQLLEPDCSRPMVSVEGNCIRVV